MKIDTSIKLALKTSIAALLSLAICHELDRVIKHPDPFVSGIWCVVASIFALQPTLGGTYKAVWNRFLGVLIGSLMGAFFAHFGGAHPLILGLAIFSAVFLCFLLGIEENYRMTALSVAVVIIPWGLDSSLSPWSYAAFRFLDTCLGLGVAVFVAQALWPSQALSTMRNKLGGIIDLVRQYFEHALTFPEISTEKMEIHKLASDNLIVEINQAFSEVNFAMEESKVEFFFGFDSMSKWVDILSNVERLWESVREINDVFNLSLQEVFDTELREEVKKLCSEIDSMFKDLVEKFKSDTSSYDFTRLAELKERLGVELHRFRETRVIRKYSLNHVERYFVFFYYVKQILIESERINAAMESGK
ncbi:MAG: aromatic acid exporter family protein [Parachlamydia sp.]|nr:aromatic acid exporter family protein [Parachlamydia sp.]